MIKEGNNMEQHLLIYLLSFVGIWIGSGIAIKSVERLSRTLRISSFSVSFLILGVFTSIGELSVGVNSILKNDPEIYVGNLIGASIVLFMLIIPLLAITGRSIQIPDKFKGRNLPMSLLVVAMPAILVLDGQIGKTDSLIALGLFVILLISIGAKRGIISQLKSFNPQSGVRVGKELIKIILAVGVIFVASKFVVDQSLYFSKILNVSPFFISLIFIAVGTNIPELSLVVRSIFMKNKQVAFGDYIGSAVFNTFLLGMLTLIYNKTVFLTNSYVVSLVFLVVGLVAFYYFARTKHSISRLEGLFLLALYLLFLTSEMVMHKNIF